MNQSSHFRRREVNDCVFSDRGMEECFARVVAFGFSRRVPSIEFIIELFSEFFDFLVGDNSHGFFVIIRADGVFAMRVSLAPVKISVPNRRIT